MQVSNSNVARIFSHGGNIFYFLPHFQREYAWDKENWKTLLEDIYNIYDQEEVEHFFGSLVVIADGNREGIIPAFKLVDGQQRLITISLMLKALHSLIKDSNEMLAINIEDLLINRYAKDSSYFKICPTKKYDDRISYQAIIDEKNVPENTESKIPEAYSYIRKELAYKIKREAVNPEELFLAITNRLYVVSINLDGKERPYEIFESLNAKGKPLTQPDLVRNYIAMRLPGDEQEDVFNQYWSKIEELLRENRSVGGSRFGELTGFLRHYLAMRTGILPSQKTVYSRFRDKTERECQTHNEFVAEISRLKLFAEYYNHLLRPETEQDREIAQKLNRLNILDMSTAYPFLMSMYDSMKQEKITRNDFLDGLDILENYLVRRYLANEPTNYLSNMFVALWREIDLSKFTTSLRQSILDKNYPNDNKIKSYILTQSMYKDRIPTRQKINFILETINRYMSKGTGGYTELDSNPTIEHIMPQTLSPAWKEMLGDDFSSIHQDYLHTLGNLTLVTQEWNSSLSNSPFDDKKQKLKKHALKLNSDYFSNYIEKWNENTIRARAEFLFQNILEIWPALGEIPIKLNSTTKPQAVIILGETYIVKSWRDVAYQTAETVSQIADDFNSIAKTMPYYFSYEKGIKPGSRQRQLSNGWWLKVNLGSSKTRNLCQRLLDLANIPEEEWLVEMRDEL